MSCLRPSFETRYALLRMRLSSNHRQLAIDDQQHTVEFVAAAQDQPGRRYHAVHALLARQPRIFCDAVDRDCGGPAKHREHRAVFEEIDRIVTPLAIGDHAPVEIQNSTELETVERYPIRYGSDRMAARRRAVLAWIGILRDRTHPGISLSSP